MTRDVHSVDTQENGTSTSRADAQAAVVGIDWDARLRAAVAATLAERERRRDERRAFAERRSWGLAQRHRRKRARTHSGRVASECPQPPKPQVQSPAPDGQTGTDDSRSRGEDDQ